MHDQRLHRAVRPSIFRKRIVRVAVQPPLTRLSGGNDGMAAGPRVLGGVTIR
jgi:hypothetical protein